MASRSTVLRLPHVPSLSWDDCRLLVESVVDYAIFMLDADGRVATWNLGAKRIKGYTSNEIVGQHFSRFYPPEDLAAGKPERALQIARRDGRVEDEGWRLRKDGSRFWASVVITALRDAEGNLRGFAKVTRDLTDRLEAEERERALLREQMAREIAEEGERRLRESEARYRALSARLEVVLEGVADGITVQDRTGRLVFANTAAARFCGLDSADALLTTSPAEIFARFDVLDNEGNPFDFENLPARRILTGREASSVVLHLRERATRREWWVLLRSSAVLDPEGRLELAVNIWHEVTAERRQEVQAKYLADATAALGKSLERDEMLSTLAGVLVPSLADWCSVYLLDGERLRHVTVKHSDASKAEAARQHRERFPLDEQRAGRAWNVVRTGRASVVDDLASEATDIPDLLALMKSTAPSSAILAPIRARDRVLGLIALVSTETPRRYEPTDVALVEEIGRRAGVAVENAHLYATAQRAAKEAEEASRTKDEFLATVSHELRTPLNAILGWSSILKGRVTTPALEKPIEVIHRNAEAQVRIIDDILDMSRVITGNFRIDARPADLVAIARDAIEVVRPSATAKKIDIGIASHSELCLLVADPERLQQVVWNLLSNAVKFTDAGGTIRVDIGQEGSCVVLSVTDTGRGIAPDFLPHVFERFKQADSSITRRVGGLGLGLALVRHIVELHGGRVNATSDGLGRGATFTITLPVRAVIPPPPSSTRAPRMASSAVTSLKLDGVRTLVVDDEPDARELLTTVLTEAGAVVETASSAREGLEALRSSLPDVLVSDLGMPDEDGFSFMRRVRALRVHEGGRTPSLALTAFAQEGDRTKALEAGFTTHVGKPVDPHTLVAAVANLAALNRRE